MSGMRRDCALRGTRMSVLRNLCRRVGQTGQSLHWAGSISNGFSGDGQVPCRFSRYQRIDEPLRLSPAAEPDKRSVFRLAVFRRGGR